MGSVLRAKALAADEEFIPSEKAPLLLNFNENSLGMSDLAKEAVIRCLDGAFRYPDALRSELTEAIAAKFDLNERQVVLGNGSSEIIQATIEAFSFAAQKRAEPVQLIVPDPTFDFAELYASSLGISVVKVPLTQGSLAIDPTATITQASVLNPWLHQENSRTAFIVDEAYAEFVTDPAFRSAVENVKTGSANVVVTRTFSKIYAMAGLRVGYGLADAKTAAMIRNFVSIDNLNVAGAVAALASLKDEAFFERSLQSTNLARKIVTDALDELGIRYLPSEANFIFHKIKGEHQLYKERMAQAHVFVGREFAPAVGYSRFTLGTPQEMRAFVRVLKSFRQKDWI